MSTLSQLPPPLLDKLRSLIRRVRRLLFLKGLAATLAVGLASLLLIMGVDASLTLFSSTARVLLSCAGLVATLFTAWSLLLRPLSRRLSLEAMARFLEIRHPELQERISTAVELLARDDPESLRGSEELIAAIVDSAIDDIAAVDPKTEFQPVRARKFLFAAAGGLGLLLLTFALWPRQSWTLMTRALAPFADLGNAYADQLRIEPGDLRVAKGSPVTIAVTVINPRQQRVELRRRLPDGSDVVERMTPEGEDPDGSKRFTLTFPSVEESFHYRIRAGSALSRYFELSAQDPPTLQTLRVQYLPPEYTGLPPSEAVSPSGEMGEIRALAHTRILVEAELDRALTRAELVLEGGEGEPRRLAAPPEGPHARWELELLPEMNGKGHFAFTDEEGFANRPLTYAIEVLPDKAPTLQVRSPLLRELRVRPSESIPLHLDLVEDFGFAEFTLLVQYPGAGTPLEIPQALPLPGESTGQYTARVHLDLATLQYPAEVRSLTVQLRAHDNRPLAFGGPGVGLSEPIVIVLDEEAKSLADQNLEAQREELDQKLREAKQSLERAREELRRSEQEMMKSEDLQSEARKRLDEFTHHNESAREALEQIADTLNTPLFQEQSRQAARLADETLALAQERVDLIPMTDAAHERLAEAKQARSQVEEALQGLNQLQKSMGEARKDYEAIARLNQLAQRQRELAREAQAWSQRAQEEAAAAREAAQRAADEAQRRQALEAYDQQQQRETDQFRQEQKRVEQQLGDLLKDNAAALAEVLAQQRAQSEAFAEQSQSLAAQQEGLRESNRQATEPEEGDAQTRLRQALLEQLAQLQSRLAGAVADAALQSETPQRLAEAADAAETVAEQLQAAALPEAAEGAEKAGEALAAQASPSSTKEQALAQRQQSLASQIRAVQEGRLQDALAQLENLLAADAQELESQTKGMEEALANLKQNKAKDRLREAASALDRGEQKAAQSSKQFDRAQAQQREAESREELQAGALAKAARATMRQAANEQRQAAEALSQAAGAFRRGSEAIGQTLEGLEPSERDERLTNSKDLAQGFQDVSRSSQSQNAPEAAEQAQNAAEALQQIAEAAMSRLGRRDSDSSVRQESPLSPPREANGEPDSSELNESGQKAADWNGDGLPAELSELGLSAADWARFRRALSGGNAIALDSQLPAEYRELVGRYFQVIAKEAGKGK